ncbi:MAG: ActS/PrrB/RegB family redox-sensitive histidine kinase [Cypionkella sp.]|uniref:sensor histidine kinase RegB n=1 Tax=Cypionkella sp. TaxID=2811411 RepID=UPI002ABAD472|nr:ActS/PrrB/RegB family redox-sensitive histidine kinase [Cypionkella sp.]MDZ4312246.1 ActS/PrrB/RegB family redox-sensitive histidine kinase [Cypionkella sp.]
MSNQRDIIAQSASFRPERADWLRLRTLIFQRWMASFGQLAALVVATRYYGMQLPLGLCFLAVGLAIIANLLSIFLFPQNKRLSETEAMLTLLFDLAQLCFLLFLTGGLTNPFALLVLAPVTVSASALALRSTLIIGAMAAGFVTLIGLFNVPLRLADGRIFQIPGLFTFGFWLSLLIGIAFLGLYSRRVATEMRSMSDALLATQMALAREQKLTDLGGVVAAAAHELGTPLATIKLISSEMIDELADHPDLAEDARLIREQANRCRDILRSMGKAGKDDLLLRQAPLATVLQEAAEPHMARGIEVIFSMAGSGPPPVVLRRPELIHGLRNLVQNAVDFARSKVWVDAQFTPEHITLRIIDDGEGFPAQVLGRIGDPFVRSRRDEQDLDRRPEYEGMGLGLFIAKTLLERTGAELSFANAADPFLSPEERPARSGAIVEVTWQAADIVAETAGGLGENQLFDQ